MLRLTILTSIDFIIISMALADIDSQSVRFFALVSPSQYVIRRRKFHINCILGFRKIHRHGARSPIVEEQYPTDPYINYTWHGGYGALSPKGARQLYDLGCTLGPIYAHLFPPDGLYSKDNMHVSSSSEERCLNSVQNLLACFMPPKPNSNSLPIAWQSVPVTFKPPNQDNVWNLSIDISGTRE